MGMSRLFAGERLFPMKKPAQVIAEVPPRQSRVEMRIGVDLGELEGRRRGRARASICNSPNWNIPPAFIDIQHFYNF